jgi:hypothetical protein
MYEAVAYYQIEIRRILHVVGDQQWRAADPPDHTLRSIRHQSS